MVAANDGIGVMNMRPFQIMTRMPSLAATISAATMVTNGFAMARRMPVRMNGTAASSVTRKKTWGSLAPRARAARILLVGIEETPEAALRMVMKIPGYVEGKTLAPP